MRKAAGLILKVLGAVAALMILAAAGLNVYLATRPAGKTIKAAGIILIPTQFRIGRPFIDYLAIGGQRLYAGYASHGMVGVIDTATNQAVAAISGLGRVHGVAIVPDRGLGFATSSGDNNINVFELGTNLLLKKIPAGDDPDAIIYDENVRLVYAGNHNGKSATLIDPTTLTVVATILLGGEPEYPQADPDTGLIYQNLEDTSELVVVDPRAHAVVKRYKLDPGTGPTGLALDAANHRLFSTCSSKLIVLNADTGAVVADLPIGAGTDGAGYDPGLKRVYTANAIGTMTVIRQDSADKYHVLENAPTHFGGHSLAIGPADHRIYLAYFGSIAVYDPIP